MIHKTAIIDSNAKISQNVTIGPYSVIGPNVEIGEGARVGASSVVLSDVPPRVSVAGVPSRIVGEYATESLPSHKMDHSMESLKEYESGGGI